MSQTLNAAASRLENWIKGEALPLWLRVGMHPRSRVHCEHLSPEGRPDFDADIRIRVQARQVFVCALAYSRGWAGAEAAATAERLQRFLVEHTLTATGGHAHRMNSRGELLDKRLDLYDHAFHILAHAWYYRALGVSSALHHAERLVDCIDRELGANNGGWLEGDYPAPYRRQNPHMHLFEAFMALYEATGSGRWLVRAGEIFSLFESHFYDPEQQVVYEYFNRDWSRAQGDAGQQVEPGHLLEWVWLLDNYGRLAGRPVEQLTAALYQRALAIGLTESGLVLDAVSAQGAVLSATKRCWPMTELIKASVVRARAGDAAAAACAAQAIDTLFSAYLQPAPVPGAYIDQRGAQDEIVASQAPASTLYHLLVAAAEVCDYVNRPQSLVPVRVSG